MPAEPTPTTALRADCSRCAGLCCVAPSFTASSDFAISKPAATPCPNLGADFGCTIHDRLRARGFPGCTVYDCFGAGQRVVQETFAGQDWRGGPEIAGPMFAAFARVRDLHEILWMLAEALRMAAARPLHDELRAAAEATDRLAGAPAAELVELDVDAHRDKVAGLLLEASELARAGLDGPEHRGADLVGRDLRRMDLRGANLRGALLIGADLHGADLRRADLTGADLRGARLGGADLRGALFVTQAQVDAARGDAATRLPDGRTRPAHWTASPARARA